MGRELLLTCMSQEKVEDVLDSMLRDHVSGKTVFDGDDWDFSNKFEEGDRVYLRCAFYEDPNAGGYVWEVLDQTSVELDITDCPEPSNGASAVVECDVGPHENEEMITLLNPKIVALETSDATIEELKSKL